MQTATADAEARFRIEVDRFRASLGRSDVLVRLFDFLVARSADEHIPKEIEIAQDVFDRSTDFETTQDASVRVYIHRLRRKLDSFYAGAEGPRLTIPRGEYRIMLTDGAAEPVTAEEEGEPAGQEPPSPVAPRPARGRRWWWAALGLFVVLNAVAWMLLASARPPDPNRAVMDTILWQPLAESDRMTFVVLGDYYIFGEAPHEMEVKRLVREFSINSREDLDQYLMTHPEDAGRFVDIGLHYLPTGTATALGDLLPYVNTALGRAARVITVSELTPYILKGANMVYVGYLSGLGMLRDPLFEASGFAVGDSYDELIDSATGKRYTSDWVAVTDNRTPHRDYAYLASFPGPSGNWILVVAGTRDAAVMQAAELAADRKQLDIIAGKAGGKRAFEALYEVRTLGNLNLGARLIVSRPLKVAGMWRSDRVNQVFPDQQPVSDRLGGVANRSASADGAPTP